MRFSRIPIKLPKKISARRTGNLIFFTDPQLKPIVQTAVGQSLLKWGAYIRRSAKQSMKKRKSASPPGQPPSVHEGSLKRLLYFYYDKSTGSVVVGPEIKKDNPTGAPNTLEFGGSQLAPAVAFREYKVGQVGPIRAIERPDKPAQLVYVRLHTEEQAHRATEIYNKYRARPARRFRIDARPYMKPALKKNLHVAPANFKSQLKGR